MLAVMPFFLTGCVFDVKDNDMLAKPRLPVELEEINTVLKEHFDSDLSLVTPLEGVNKKSIQFVDLDGDGEDEVIVLHSKENDQFAMKVTVLSKQKEKWRINTDIQGIGYDVNRIDYPDLDGDGVKEIVVGWQSGALLNKGISIYKHGEKGYTEIYKDSYTSFIAGDVDNDHIEDLLMIKLSRSEGYARYILYKLKDGVVEPVSEVLADGYVNDYPNVLLGKLDVNHNGVFIDAKVGSVSGFTDVLYYDQKELKSAYYNKRTQSSDKTFRQADRSCTDINGDGVYEIPTVFKGFGEGTYRSAQWITQWNRWVYPNQLQPVEKSFDDINQGYRLILPDEWNDQVALTLDSSGCQAFLKATAKTPKTMICQIKIVERKNDEASRKGLEEKGYVELGKTLDKIFWGRVSSPVDEGTKALFVTIEQLKQFFKLI